MSYPFPSIPIFKNKPAEETEARGKGAVIQEKLWSKAFLSIASINLCVQLSGNILMTAFPFYIVSLGGDEITVGLAASLYALCGLFSRFLAGWLLDHQGRRMIFFIGLILMICIPPLYILFPVIGAALVLRMIHGGACGIANTSSNTNAIDVMPRSRFGEAIGLLGLTNSLSMVLGPALGLFFWQQLGATLLFVIVSAISLVCFFLLRQFRSRPITPKKENIRSLADLVHKVFDKGALPAAALMTLACIPGGAVTSFIALFAAETGCGNGGISFTFQAIGTACTRVFAGRFTDRYGEAPAVYFSCSMFLLGIMIMVYGGQAWTLYLGGFFMGVAYGVIIPAMQAMAVRTVPAERRGSATSIYLSSWDLSSGIGGILGGVFIKWFGYHAMFTILCVSLLICILVYRFWAAKTPSAFRVYQTMQEKQKTG